MDANASDPEEDDIGSFDFVGPRDNPFRALQPDRTRSDPLTPFIYRRADGPASDQSRTNPPSNAILQRFADMLMHDLGAGPGSFGGPPRPPGQETLFPEEPGQEQAARGPFGGPDGVRQAPRFHRTTIRSGVNGGTSLTITTTSTDGASAGFPTAFPTLFSQILRNATPLPLDGHDHHHHHHHAGADSPDARAFPPPGAMPFGGLHELLTSLLNPQAAVHGDAVYTQEALDRIITTLMEANPQSNAAPPATQAAIERLEKKKLDDKMIGTDGKAECTICIDELVKGDEVSVLPCAHWFHGECVTLWLKEHNTCPICRAPIEARPEPSPGGRGPDVPGGRGPDVPGSRGPGFLGGLGGLGPDIIAHNISPNMGSGNVFGPQMSRYGYVGGGEHYPGDRLARSPSQNQERLNSIRNLGGYGTPNRSPDTTTNQARRNSMSPANPQTDDGASRFRVRSPSRSHDRSPTDYFSSSRYGNRDRESPQTPERSQQNGQSSSHSSHSGPLSWLRDRFGSHGSGSDRDRRR